MLWNASDRPDTQSISLQWGDYDFNDPGLFNFLVTVNDIGKRFSFNSGIDFNTTVSWLNDGINNEIINVCSNFYHGAACSGGPESEIFLGFDSFADYHIESIDFIIKDLWFKTPGENPNGDGLWADTEITFDMEVYDAKVPESPTWLLFSSVFLGLLLRKRLTSHPS